VPAAVYHGLRACDPEARIGDSAGRTSAELEGYAAGSAVGGAPLLSQSEGHVTLALTLNNGHGWPSQRTHHLRAPRLRAWLCTRRRGNEKASLGLARRARD